MKVFAIVLLVVALAAPASAHQEWNDPFHTHQQQENYYDNFMRQQEQRRQRATQQQERDRDEYNRTQGQALRNFDCLGENFRSCRGR